MRLAHVDRRDHDTVELFSAYADVSIRLHTVVLKINRRANGRDGTTRDLKNPTRELKGLQKKKKVVASSCKKN